jgi:LmbE family N-acetylglucosaminyl deacetylase
MKKDFIQEIISKKKPCVIVSPHFDDSVLSCGTLLTQLSGKTKITVVNVFTQAHKAPYTLSARKFLMESGIKDATKLYGERLKEDSKALSHFKAKIVNLGLEDAIFRVKKTSGFLGKLLPEFSHVYPTYQWHVVKGISSQDHAIADLTTALKKVVTKDAVVLAPYAIGQHVDHQIVRKVCEQLFPDVIFYSDFPYNVRNGTYGEAGKDREKYVLQTNTKQKNALIQIYETQLNGLFPEGTIPAHKEVYFIPKHV